jgi:pimeloyl-ACP methyl ester carboxylesterase
VNVSPAYAADPAHYEAYQPVALAVKVPIPVVMMQFQAAIEHDAMARLSQITVPTMVVHGTLDEMLVPANGELIAKQIPGARLELLEGAGHLFWWEEPERTVALLRSHTGVG